MLCCNLTINFAPKSNTVNSPYEFGVLDYSSRRKYSDPRTQFEQFAPEYIDRHTQHNSCPNCIHYDAPNYINPSTYSTTTRRNYLHNHIATVLAINLGSANTQLRR